MSSAVPRIDGLMTEILSQNAIALLLRKSFNYDLSDAATAMADRFSNIERQHPDFALRILAVAYGRADQRTLSAFLEDFRILSCIIPDIQLHQVNFNYLEGVPDYHLPGLSRPRTLVPDKSRERLIIILLFIIAFQNLDTSGALRLSCPGMVAAFGLYLKMPCLRILTYGGSVDDIFMFDTTYMAYYPLPDELVLGSRRAEMMRRRTSEENLSDLLSFIGSHSSQVMDVDDVAQEQEVGENCPENEPFDMETYLGGESDRMYYEILNALDDEIVRITAHVDILDLNEA